MEKAKKPGVLILRCSHLSGLNSAASSPKLAGFLCAPYMEIITRSPLRRKSFSVPYSPPPLGSHVSLFAFLMVRVNGGKSLNATDKIRLWICGAFDSITFIQHAYQVRKLVKVCICRLLKSNYIKNTLTKLFIDFGMLAE